MFTKSGLLWFGARDLNDFGKGYDPMDTSELKEHLSEATSTYLWGDAMDDCLANWDAGFVEYLNMDDFAIVIERGSKLLVVFEFVDDIVGRSRDRLPTGWELAEENGWSYLCFAINKTTENYTKDVFGYFEELTEDGLFSRHTRAALYGAQELSSLACMFSAYIQHASVIAVDPPQDLVTVTAGTNDSAKGQGVAGIPSQGLQEALKVIEQLVLVMDPCQYHPRHDPQRSGNTCFVLNCRLMAPSTATFIRQLGLHTAVIEEAMSEQPAFQNLNAKLRKRRDFRPYLRHLLRKNQRSNRTLFERIICQNVTNRMHAPFFEKRLKQL